MEQDRPACPNSCFSPSPYVYALGQRFTRRGTRVFEGGQCRKRRSWTTLYQGCGRSSRQTEQVPTWKATTEPSRKLLARVRGREFLVLLMGLYFFLQPSNGKLFTAGSFAASHPESPFQLFYRPSLVKHKKGKKSSRFSSAKACCDALSTCLLRS